MLHACPVLGPVACAGGANTADTQPLSGSSPVLPHAPHIWRAQVAGTPLEGDAYFGSEATITASLPEERRMAVYSDLVRYLLLHNYGGLWCGALLLVPPASASVSACTPACTEMLHDAGRSMRHGASCRAPGACMHACTG